MGAWIEIYNDGTTSTFTVSRTPRWVRGLKYRLCDLIHRHFASHPTMGAWIEMCPLVQHEQRNTASHPTMGAWIEIISSVPLRIVNTCRTPRWVRGLKYQYIVIVRFEPLSHPTMGAWIEISAKMLHLPTVA